MKFNSREEAGEFFDKCDEERREKELQKILSEIEWPVMPDVGKLFVDAKGMAEAFAKQPGSKEQNRRAFINFFMG